MSSKEKNHELYLRQKALLDTFLEKHAITQAQYNKSFHDLTEKMGESSPESLQEENPKKSVQVVPADIQVVNIVTNDLIKGEYGDSMKEKKGIIFDMDGTVWDSSENVAASWTEMIHKMGYQDKYVTRDDITRVMGKPMDVIADTLFTYTERGAERDALRAACEQHENEYLREHGGILYDGVLESWRTLKEMGYHIYIVSNCQAGYIEAFLGYYGIPFGKESDLVEDIECYGNNFLQKDENIRLIATRNALTSSCYVGDIQSDYDATMKAGLPFIHARYGFGTIQEEVPYVHNFSELIQVVPEVIG